MPSRFLLSGEWQSEIFEICSSSCLSESLTDEPEILSWSDSPPLLSTKAITDSVGPIGTPFSKLRLADRLPAIWPSTTLLKILTLSIGPSHWFFIGHCSQNSDILSPSYILVRDYHKNDALAWAGIITFIRLRLLKRAEYGLEASTSSRAVVGMAI